MEESQYPFVNFCNCLDKVAEAEQEHNLKAMRYYLKKAETYPIVSHLHKWLLEYTKNIYKFLYGDNADKDEITKKLLELRKDAIRKPETFEDFENSVYRFVKEPYVRLLSYVLISYYERKNFVAEYEELCLEIMEIMEAEQWKLLDDKDYYSAVHMMIASYYNELGRPSVSYQYYQKVWDKYKTETNISNACFYTLCQYIKNLTIIGKLSNVYEVENFLLDKLTNDQIKYSNDIEIVNITVHTFMYEFITNLGYTERPELALQVLESMFKEKIVSKKSWNEKTIYIYLAYLIQLNEKNKTCSLKKQWEIKSYLKKYKKKYAQAGLADWQVIDYYLVWYILLKITKSKKALVYIDKITEILLTEKINELDRMAFLAGISFVIDEYNSMRQKGKAFQCAKCFMMKNVGFYSTAEFSLDNKNMEEYLAICDFHFQYTYQAIVDIASKEQKFEFSLNCKKILSSAIRLRNKLDVADEKKIQLRQKNPYELKYFELEIFKKSIPDNTAVIDFLYLEPEIHGTKRRIINNPGRAYDLDIFVIAKRHGACVIEYKSIPQANVFNEKLITLMDKMKSGNGKMQKLSEEIYKELIGDFQNLLEDVRHFWICPDGILCNFSFDTLFLLAGKNTDSKYNFTYWQSLRDVFEVWKKNNEKVSSCMIGNPKFELEKGYNHINPDKDRQKVIAQLPPLPYSGYEAVKLSELMQGDCFINEKATKFVLKPGYRYIHIATHGFVYTDGKNPWYDSRLAFSGAQNYLVQGADIEGYGDGFISAEEISKINFSGTELVVLSACSSGNSIFSEHRQETGLHVAFGVAGVKYIISALWEVDDFATAVLMNYLYDNIKNNMPVPIALHSAKLQLRRTTAKELVSMVRNDKENMPDSYTGLLSEFEQLPDNYCCYSSVKYWGSFICNRAMY